MVEKVGFVGLGIMGAAMAGNLLEAEHELVVHNRTRTKAEQLAQHGARVADSPREVAETSDVVITMLPGPPEVEEVVVATLRPLHLSLSILFLQLPNAVDLLPVPITLGFPF